MKAKIIIFLLLLITAITLVAQSNQQNKYWFYRYRLRHKFLKAGLVDYSCLDISKDNFISGYSIPAGIINYNNPPDQLSWGDGTAELGWYIGILATEWRLLHNARAATDSTEQELYYAMKAYERLDLHAERNMYPYKNDGCIRNGFFVRDDVTKSFFLKYFKNLNFSSAYSDRGEGSELSQEIINNHGKGGAHASQDQVINLMMGLALVVKSIDNNTNYNGFRFKDMAKEYTNLMVGYMASANYTQPIPYTPYLADHSQDIKYQSYGIAKAAQRIVKDNWGGDLFEERVYENKVTNQFYGLWQEGGTTIGEIAFSLRQGYRMGLALNLAAIGHSWRYGLVPIKHDICINLPLPYPCNGLFRPWCPGPEFCASTWCYEKPQDIPILGADLGSVLPTLVPGLSGACVPFPLPTLAINTTSLMLSHYGKAFDVGYFPLLHQYLHNSNNPFVSNSYYDDKFASAPCEGPYLFEDGSGVQGWRASNIWTDNIAAKDGIPKFQNHPDFRGQFNGMDYMLAYNIYKLVKNDELYTNYLNRQVSQSYPNAVNEGSDINPLQIWAYESVVIDSKLSASTNPSKNANIQVWAGEEIVLGENFEVEQGANFNAEIRVINCSGVSTPIVQNAASSSPRVAYREKPISNSDHKTEIAKEWITQIEDAQYKYTQAKKEAYQSLEDYVANAEKDFPADAATLYPNPVIRYAQVTLALDKPQLVSIVIYDLVGKQLLLPIQNQTYSTEDNLINLDLEALPTGTYIYEIKYGDNSIKKDKIIKQP